MKTLLDVAEAVGAEARKVRPLGKERAKMKRVPGAAEVTPLLAAIQGMREALEYVKRCKSSVACEACRRRADTALDALRTAEPLESDEATRDIIAAAYIDGQPEGREASVHGGGICGVLRVLDPLLRGPK